VPRVMVLVWAAAKVSVVQGIETVFVLFRKQSIGCSRIGCLRFDRPKHRAQSSKTVVRQSLSTLGHLDTARQWRRARCGEQTRSSSQRIPPELVRKGI